MGSPRIKNPHHMVGIIPSLALETQNAREFQAKKRCENATQAFHFGKRARLPTGLRWEIDDQHPRPFSRISAGFEERFCRPTVFLFSTAGFHGNGGRTCISYNTLRKPCSAAVHGGPTAKELPGRFTVVFCSSTARKSPSGRPAGGAATALGTGRGPLISLRDGAAVARNRFSTGRSIALPNAPNAIAQRELKVLICDIP